jgi:hypothetical protein
VLLALTNKKRSLSLVKMSDVGNTGQNMLMPEYLSAMGMCEVRNLGLTSEAVCINASLDKSHFGSALPF